MEITVCMFSNFLKYLPDNAERDRCIVKAEEDITVSALLEFLNIPDQKPKVITVNDTNRKEDFVLTDKDIVKIFPVAMGG